MRWLTSVSWGSGLTGRRQGEPVELPDEEEDAPGSMRLGVHELPRRREKDGGAGYSSLGVLPPSMYSRTASSVRPGTPHHRRRPSGLSLPEGTMPFVDSSCLTWRRRKYGSQSGLSGT